jgi:hypothetical protein
MIRKAKLLLVCAFALLALSTAASMAGIVLVAKFAVAFPLDGLGLKAGAAGIMLFAIALSGSALGQKLVHRVKADIESHGRGGKT